MQVIFSPELLSLTIQRLALELLEREDNPSDIIFIGLQPRGVYVSDRIVAEIRKLCPGNEINYGVLDITFYRDDVRNELHAANKTDIPFSIDNKKVILIDDVLYTGRTIRAALDALQDFGRPKKVELCVLVNRRFERELPITPDHTGKTIDTDISQKVKVDREKGDVILS